MFSPSAHRNKDAILEILKQFTSSNHGNVLEIASGTGQHACYFAEHIPNYTWQPSDCSEKYLSSVNNYVQQNPNLKNIKNPIFVDITEQPNCWNQKHFDESFLYHIMLNVNMIHITPIECTQGLFSAAGKLLKDSGKLITYGPYSVNGVLSPESNVRFDKSLKDEDPSWGIRDISQLEKFAKNNHLKLENIFDMPSNNKCLVFVKNVTT